MRWLHVYLSRNCPTCQEFERKTLNQLGADSVGLPGLGFWVMRTYAGEGEPDPSLDYWLRTGKVSRVPTTLVYQHDEETGADTLLQEPRVGMLTLQEVLTLMAPEISPPSTPAFTPQGSPATEEAPIVKEDQ